MNTLLGFLVSSTLAVGSSALALEAVIFKCSAPEVPRSPSILHASTIMGNTFMDTKGPPTGSPRLDRKLQPDALISRLATPLGKKLFPSYEFFFEFIPSQNPMFKLSTSVVGSSEDDSIFCVNDIDIMAGKLRIHVKPADSTYAIPEIGDIPIHLKGRENLEMSVCDSGHQRNDFAEDVWLSSTPIGKGEETGVSLELPNAYRKDGLKFHFNFWLRIGHAVVRNGILEEFSNVNPSEYLDGWGDSVRYTVSYELIPKLWELFKEPLPNNLALQLAVSEPYQVVDKVPR